MIKYNFFDNLISKLDKISFVDLKKVFIDLSDKYSNIRTVFNSMAEGVLVIDSDESVLFYNKTGCRLFQIQQISEGTSLKNAISNTKIYDLLKRLISKNDKIITEEIKLENEKYSYLQFSVYPLVKDGKIIGTIIIAEDITEKKESENKLKQIESIQALTTLTAGIAHEIKNPLGAMSIHVQLLEQEISKCKCMISEDLMYSLNIVNEEIERLNEIVVNFLYSVRPMTVNMTLTNLNEYLDKIIDLAQPEMQAKGIKFHKDFDKLPAVWLDENIFKQAVLNLIQNSIAAVENKKGIISIGAESRGSYVYINIKDNGDGIPDDIQLKIFDPYFTTKSYGTGLGLTIVYKIIREHKGEVTFSSGKGETVFSIRLPVPFTEKGLIEYDG